MPLLAQYDYQSQQIHKFFIAYIILVVVAYSLTIHLGYQGEEGVYVSTSLEMWYHQHYTQPLLYGSDFWRPPLLNWIIIPLASTFGWEHALAVSRVVNISSTLLTAAVLYWFVRQIFSQQSFALLATVVFLSGDILFKRGWLAYSDSLFSLFAFAAIACLWVALEKRKSYLFILAALSLLAAFLTKAITAFAFYAVALIVLALWHPQRKLLLNPVFYISHLFAIVFVLTWNSLYLHDGGSGMLVDITRRFVSMDILEYLRQKVNFQLHVLLRHAPLLPLALFLFFSRYYQPQQDYYLKMKMLLLIIFINYLPYALAPYGVFLRYIMPLYPLMALAVAYVFWCSRASVPWVVAILALSIVFKIILATVGYDWYDKRKRQYDAGKFNHLAAEILVKTRDYPLYLTGYTPSLSASLQQQNLPAAPIVSTRFRPQTVEDYFIVGETVPEHAQQLAHYRNGRMNYYLSCVGKACSKT